MFLRVSFLFWGIGLPNRVEIFPDFLFTVKQYFCNFLKRLDQSTLHPILPKQEATVKRGIASFFGKFLFITIKSVIKTVKNLIYSIFWDVVEFIVRTWIKLIRRNWIILTILDSKKKNANWNQKLLFFSLFNGNWLLLVGIESSRITGGFAWWRNRGENWE